MSLRIYEMAHSPYCIPITRALAALGVAFERISVPNGDRCEVIRLTHGAYYQVPVLVHEDNIVYESSDHSLDVAHYVDRIFANGRLFPQGHSSIDEVIIAHIENELEGLTFRLCDVHYIPSLQDDVERVSVIRHKERRFGRGCVDHWRRDQEQLREQTHRLLGRFDQQLQHRDFILQADAPTYVDYALLGVIENLTHGGHEKLPPDQIALNAWQERLLSFRF